MARTRWLLAAERMPLTFSVINRKATGHLFQNT